MSSEDVAAHAQYEVMRRMSYDATLVHLRAKLESREQEYRELKQEYGKLKQEYNNAMNDVFVLRARLKKAGIDEEVKSELEVWA